MSPIFPGDALLTHPRFFRWAWRSPSECLKFDPAKGRVSLGIVKQLVPDPWVGAAERMKEGERIEGRVVSVTDYGAFVELEPGVEGLHPPYQRDDLVALA